jgi:hypothetical protein
MRRILVCVALPLLVGAGPVDETPRQVSLTIYNGNLALVQEVRGLDIPRGRTRLEFRNVSTGIRPETVALTGAGLGIVEQNYDYDLLTPGKMMEKAVGKQIQIVRTNPATGAETMATATVLSVNSGVVLRIGDRIEVLRDDGIPTKVIFDGIPENLRARPTLSVTVEAASAGPRDATLSYLTTGLSWVADYVAQYDEARGRLSLQGWVTLTNRTDTRFVDVAPRLVAENMGTPAARSFPPAGAGGVRTAGTGSAQEQNEDFPIYVLPQKVTVAEQQTKQVSFIEMPDVPARKTYEYEAGGFYSAGTPDHVVTFMGFANPKAMPAGTVRVYVRDTDGNPKFIGEPRLAAAPGGSQIALRLGEAFDVTIQPTVVNRESLSNNRARYVMRYEFRNARNEAVRIRFRQRGLGGLGDSVAQVTDESIPGRRIDAFSQEWDVPVPANGMTALTFTTTGN